MSSGRVDQGNMVVVHFSGRGAAVLRALVYFSLGITVFVRKDDAHRVRLYHGHAYIDCEVDGDNDPGTCLSDFTVVPISIFNAGYVVGGALLAAAFLSVCDAIWNTAHRASYFVYLDGVIVNAALNFAIAATCGVQESLTLALMVLLTGLLYLGVATADRLTWASPARSRTVVADLVFLASSLVVWFVILYSLNDYWSTSYLPLYIPSMAAVACVAEFFNRWYVWSFFHRSVPNSLRILDPEEDASLFGQKSNAFSVPLLESLDRSDPFVVDWFDSVRNLSNLIARTLIGILFYVGTNDITIKY